MDYNTMQQPTQLEEALQQFYFQFLKNKALTKSMFDNIFDMLIAVFVGLALILLCNRFIPSNFMGYENVQPALSIGVALVTFAFIAYKAYLKKSKMRK